MRSQTLLWINCRKPLDRIFNPRQLPLDRIEQVISDKEP
jgi:hypothetical protein